MTDLYGGGLTTGEISLLGDFMDAGGSILFMADFDKPVTDINNALSGLGSSMMLYGDITDIGHFYASGWRIASDPFTDGVSSFYYGATYGVSGGTSLFYSIWNGAVFAYEGQMNEGQMSVPEHATMLLLGSCLLGFAGFRRRFIRKS